MRTPDFWQKRGVISYLLQPIAVLYDMLSTFRRCLITPAMPPVPVICVGNVTAGGAGKTPIALYIGQWLKAKKINAFFLSRGYGGRALGPVLVDTYAHSAQDVGDEPLLLAKLLPTVVAQDRVAGADFAARHGAQLIVMDDGLQNPSLIKSLSLVVIDGTIGFGNGRLLPAGPLRESPEYRLRRCDAIIVINPGKDTPHLPVGSVIIHAHTHPQIHSLANKNVVAFCGIAYPQKFFTGLKEQGAQIMDSVVFADHHRYTPRDVQMLAQRAKHHQARLVTTAKDAVRLPKDFLTQVTVTDVTVSLDNPALLEALLTRAARL